MRATRFYCPPKYCQDRSYEDILPTDIIEALETDPNDFYTPDEEKREKIEIYHEVSRSNINTKQEFPTYSPINTIKKTIQHFKVQIENEIVNALCLFDCMDRKSDYVIVRGGKYVQSGKIIQNLTTPEKIETSYQIIGIDQNENLKNYLNIQKVRALGVSKMLVRKYNLKTEVLDCFAVCGRVRSLLRIKVTDANAENIDYLAHGLIKIFCCSIEIYDKD